MSLSRSYSRRNKTTLSSSSSHSSLSSFSSSSSSPSSWNCDSPINPITPLQSFGVPFSWENSPGVRNKSHVPRNRNYEDPYLQLLPLPPAARSAPTTELKKLGYNYVGRDPFTAALVKCSKKDLHKKSHVDDYWKIAKPSRAVNDLVGIVDRYTSCKTTCSVVDSTVFIPRSGLPVYDFSNRRRSRFGWTLRMCQSRPYKLWPGQFQTLIECFLSWVPCLDTNWMVRISCYALSYSGGS